MLYSSRGDGSHESWPAAKGFLSGIGTNIALKKAERPKAQLIVLYSVVIIDPHLLSLERIKGLKILATDAVVLVVHAELVLVTVLVPVTVDGRWAWWFCTLTAVFDRHRPRNRQPLRSLKLFSFLCILPF
jgi:hypothetical protein